jgi:endoglucanase
MLFNKVVSWLFLASSTCLASVPQVRRASSILPLSTKGRDVIDANGDVFHYKATNWPGHQEIVIPEGLQYSSIKSIVSWFPKLGLNSVRLTFAIEMIDEYYSNSPNQTLEKSVINALGQVNGTKVLNQILAKNSQFSRNTTRLQVWDAVGKELSSQGIVIHLDNHVSKASWCCDDDDGNAWFGDKFFDVENWKRGLSFMAKHVCSPSTSRIRRGF